jgi:hypothetical protein
MPMLDMLKVPSKLLKSPAVWTIVSGMGKTTFSKIETSIPNPYSPGTVPHAYLTACEAFRPRIHPSQEEILHFNALFVFAASGELPPKELLEREIRIRLLTTPKEIVALTGRCDKTVQTRRHKGLYGIQLTSAHRSYYHDFDDVMVGHYAQKEGRAPTATELNEKRIDLLRGKLLAIGIKLACRPRESAIERMVPRSMSRRS